MARAASSTALHGATARPSSDDVVAERLAEAARLEEVALHVDDDQRGARKVERHGLGLSLDRRAHACLPDPVVPVSEISKIEAKRRVSANVRIDKGFGRPDGCRTAYNASNPPKKWASMPTNWPTAARGGS